MHLLESLMVKRNLDAISLLGRVSQDVSSRIRQKLKPALHPKCAGLCDISKRLVKAEEVGGLRKHFQPETYKNFQGSKYQNRFKHYSPKDSFCTRAFTSARDHHKPETKERGDR